MNAKKDGAVILLYRSLLNDVKYSECKPTKIAGSVGTRFDEKMQEYKFLKAAIMDLAKF